MKFYSISQLVTIGLVFLGTHIFNMALALTCFAALLLIAAVSIGKLLFSNAYIKDSTGDINETLDAIAGCLVAIACIYVGSHNMW